MLRGHLTVLVCGGLAAVLHGGLPQADPPLIASNKVKNLRGKAVTVCGKVVSHECDEKTGDTTLDLDRAYWSKPVAVLIGEDARRMFPPQLEDHYVRADICASGVVERLKGRDVVRVNGPERVVVKAPAPPGFGPGAARPCDPEVELPKLTYEEKPSYTREAMRAQEQGRVFLEAVVLPDGTVGPIRPLVGFKPESGLNEAAVNAVKQWRFKPGTVSGRPAPVVVTVELTFTLK